MPTQPTRLFLAPLGVEPPAGWLSVSAGTLRGMHLPSGSADAAYVEDLPSIMRESELVVLLEELNRIVKPGGWRDSADGTNTFVGGLIRIATPDIATATRAYIDADMTYFKLALGAGADEVTPGAALAMWLSRYAPVRAYDHGSMTGAIRRAGLNGVYRSARHKSLVPDLRDQAFDGQGEHRLYFECWREATSEKEAA
ncbi:MAG: hypothetical protein GC200_05285 [Tepidisphaera sp.]|nr:hypothetical protein [Tepidisphaera sp.]